MSTHIRVSGKVKEWLDRNKKGNHSATIMFLIGYYEGKRRK